MYRREPSAGFRSCLYQHDLNHSRSAEFIRAFKRSPHSEPYELRLHDLRHSAASLMLAAGADLRLIMETLGHRQIAITANLYTHVAPKLQRDIADKLDQVFSTVA